MIRQKTIDLINKLNTGHCTIKQSFDLDSSISLQARTLGRIMCYLKFQVGNKLNECVPSQLTLSELLGRSVRQVQRYLDELVKAGYIRVVRRGSISNRYEFIREIRVILNNDAKNAKEIMEKKAEVATERAEGLRKTYGNKAKSQKQGHFNNFKQREYDFEDLEKKLLASTMAQLE